MSDIESSLYYIANIRFISHCCGIEYKVTNHSIEFQFRREKRPCDTILIAFAFSAAYKNVDAEKLSFVRNSATANFFTEKLRSGTVSRPR